MLRWLCSLALPCLLAACGAGTPPDGGGPGGSSTAQRLLVLVNQARAQAQVCGDSSHGPTHALRLDARLVRAAQAHSEDMLEMQRLTHTGSDGSNPGQRIARTGYQAAGWGENAAVGYRTPEDVMRGWLGSPGHCSNLMNPNHQDFGAGEAGHYWTQVFARPR